MIAFLIGLVLFEGGIALLLMLPLPPLHKFVMNGIRILKTGRRSLVVKTLAGAMAIVLASTVNSIYRIERGKSKFGSTAADHFMPRTYLLEASLMGYSLFLALIVSQLHNQVSQIGSLKLNIEILQKQAKSVEKEYLRLKKEQSPSKEKENIAVQEEIVSLKDLVAELREKMEELQLESLEKDKAAKAAEANARALQKQSEGFLLEYDRLLEDNQNLHSQLSYFL